MFEKDLRMGLLLDFYGEMLADRTKDMMKQYYEDDLSLSEIAEMECITRQGVRHAIKKGEEALLHLEDRLKLAERFSALATLAQEIKQEASSLSTHESPDVKACAKRIIDAAQKIEADL